ncbi:MAG: amidophosphoribosyltransferase [Candidatus Bathyarchaeota archaeon]|nr:amidophosphoribosyltransferase [Candidatus Bathyarchaeota archaeon]MDH5787043.1 amidophosphoribosyltransferase [Candidatus Bathyarchaeota archaeon]
MGEQLRIACGVFAAINFDKQPIFPYIYWGLRAQNHRGHQSHGFLTYDGGKFHAHRSLDLVPKIKTSAIQEWFGRLPGYIGIGNVRYTTSGKCDEKSLISGTQPVTASKNGLKLAISFNGNVVNTFQLKKEIGEHFRDFSYECDADLISHKLLIELLKGKDLTSAVKTCMQEIEGAFSVAGITKDGDFFAFKDPHSIRPLCAGHGLDSKTYAFSSETVSLDVNGLERDFELEAGELVRVTEDGFEREQLVKEPRKAFCAFEFAYFARPDSRFDDKYVYEIREEFGRNIVRENPNIVKDADTVLSIPETGDDSAMGVHEESGLRWERASRRHRYVTERAFILLNKERYATIDKKINILASKIKGKRVIITEDSIVRGDTTRVTIEKLRRMGAKKVYVFVTFPRIIGPCFYGIDMSTYGQLIGSKHNTEEIAKIIGANAICYQSIEGLIKATGFSRDQLCLACITGRYPTPLGQRIAEEMKKRFLEGYEETGRLYELEEAVQNVY